MYYVFIRYSLSDTSPFNRVLQCHYYYEHNSFWGLKLATISNKISNTKERTKFSSVDLCFLKLILPSVLLYMNFKCIANIKHVVLIFEKHKMFYWKIFTFLKLFFIALSSSTFKIFQSVPEKIASWSVMVPTFCRFYHNI